MSATGIDPTDLVLASSSLYRAQLLSRLALPFRQVAPDIDESRRSGERPADYVTRLAREKAAAAASREDCGRSLCIGSDQTAVNGETWLGKPGDPARAERQLRDASGREITFYTGVAVQDTRSTRVLTRVVTDRVQFRRLTDDEIRRYVRTDTPVDSAGAFKAEGLGITLFDRLESTDPTSLIGLPLITLSALLREFGYLLP